MTFPRFTVNRPVGARVLRSVAVAAATWSALLVAGCSVDSKGFGGFDAGLGGTGTGATSASGGISGGSGGLTGSGGVSGTGGMAMSGSGGAHASGGVSGTGGRDGSGGAAGGHVGSGGLGDGGRMGSGGAGGRGGHDGTGSGGKMGMGGSGGKGGPGGAGGGGGGQSGETCAQYADDYMKAMTEARACTVGATAQCQQFAPATLTYCTGCPQVSVNDATELTAIRAQWVAAGCAVPTVCPAIACVVPIMGTCVATDAGAMGGICQTPIAGAM